MTRGSNCLRRRCDTSTPCKARRKVTQLFGFGVHPSTSKMRMPSLFTKPLTLHVRFALTISHTLTGISLGSTRILRRLLPTTTYLLNVCEHPTLNVSIYLPPFDANLRFASL